MIRSVCWMGVSMALAAVAAEAVCRAWMWMPWREYKAECELCHVSKVKGVEYCSFDGEGRGKTVCEFLFRNNVLWSSSGFREKLDAGAVCGEKPQDVRACLHDAEVEVRNQKSCVVVRTKSSSRIIAVGCANAFARAIVSDFASEGEKRRQQSVKQLRQNYEKHVRHVQRLQERLQEGLDKAESIQKEMESEDSLMKSLKSQIESLADEKQWGESLKQVMRAEDTVKLVPLERLNVYWWTFVVAFAGWLLVAVAAVCKRVWVGAVAKCKQALS